MRFGNYEATRANVSDGTIAMLYKGKRFGELTDCESAWVFVSDDLPLMAYVNEGMEADFTLREMLSHVAERFDAFHER